MDDKQPRVGAGASKQSSWDSVRTSITGTKLLSSTKDDEGHAQLLAVSTKESDAWLYALLVSSLRLRKNVVGITVVLRLDKAVGNILVITVDQMKAFLVVMLSAACGVQDNITDMLL